MRHLIKDFAFLHDMLEQGGPAAILGGFVALGLGFAYDKILLVVIGAFIVLLVCGEYIFKYLSKT